MFEAITFNENNRWDTIVKSFPGFDVYYLSGYVRSLGLKYSDIPLLLYYTSSKFRVLKVSIKRDVALSTRLLGVLSTGLYFDLVTPYGYGGPLIDGNPDDNDFKGFCNEYIEFCASNSIVSDFDRLHPLLKNHIHLEKCTNVIPLGKTITIRLDNEQLMWERYTSTNRNMIRKAKKLGIQIVKDKSMKAIMNFIELYNQTMTRKQADDSYFFDQNYYLNLFSMLSENTELFTAYLDGIPIASSIMLVGSNSIHYHLSGSDQNYRNYPATNLLLHEAAIWGLNLGFKYFHLGGGVGSREDNLYKFKSNFNPVSDTKFYVAKTILDIQKYELLSTLSKVNESNEPINSDYFPNYRS